MAVSTLPPRWADLPAYLPIWAALAPAAVLPHRGRLAYGARLGRLATHLLPAWRRRVFAHLGLIWPEMPAAERARIFRGMGDAFGRTFIEILHNAAFHRAGTVLQGPGAGWEAIAEAAAAGRGAVLVSGHFGQWEAVRVLLRARGIGIAGLYRPTENSWANARYVRNMEAGGRPMVPKTARGMRDLVRFVAAGGFAAMLVDQHYRGGKALDFLGQPAPTSTVAAEIALKYDRPLIPIYGIREPCGIRIRVEAEAPIPPGDPAAMMQAVNDSLAERVRQHPEQYNWVHRRWRKDLGD